MWPSGGGDVAWATLFVDFLPRVVSYRHTGWLHVLLHNHHRTWFESLNLRRRSPQLALSFSSVHIQNNHDFNQLHLTGETSGQSYNTHGGRSAVGGEYLRICKTNFPSHQSSVVSLRTCIISKMRIVTM